MDYNYAFKRMGVNLVILISELKTPNFLILISFRVSQRELKPQEARQPLICILDSFNKFSKVLTNKLLDALPPCRKVDHKIKVVPRIVLSSKAPYRLNQKELEKL